MLYLDEKNNPNFLYQFEDIIIEDVDILLNEKSFIIDVRSEKEFLNSRVPNSINIPILPNFEREDVGKTYKYSGKKNAIEVGYEYFKNDMDNFVHKLEEAILYKNAKFIMCARGGLRSKISQGIYYIYKYGDLNDEKYFKSNLLLDKKNEFSNKCLRVLDGYKSLRNRCIQEITKNIFFINAYSIGGYTGCGKTNLINSLKNSINLEEIAKHRGSAFGDYIESQPTQANFENDLAYQIFNKKNKYPFLVFEKEGANIGKLNLPIEFLNYLNSLNIILVESDDYERLENIYNTYVVDLIKEYEQMYGDYGFKKWVDFVEASLLKIQKKLGYQNYKELKLIFENANKQDLEKHKDWIYYIMKKYYDPLYENKKKNWENQVVYRGNIEECREYLIDKLKE